MLDNKLKIEGNLELDASLIDINQSNGVGVCKTDYRLSSVGTGVSWRPSGVQTKRTLYVTKNGCDTNSGLLEGDAKFTIGAWLQSLKKEIQLKLDLVFILKIIPWD